jgi:MinD-like ATPase involved in chromosome partitioning or flagellar assembly
VLEGGRDAPKLADVVKESILPGVRIATNGSPLDNYGEVAASGRDLVAEARRLADIVIIDTAPLLVAHEATELIPAADTVLVVCRSGQTSKEDAARAREMLTRLRASVAGVVLVGAPESETGYSTYYYETQPRPPKRSVGAWLLGRRPPPPPVDNARPESAPRPERKRAVT